MKRSSDTRRRQPQTTKQPKMININDKTQCLKLSKLFEELNKREDLRADGGYDDIGYNTMTKTMYVPLENTLDLKDNLTLVLAINNENPGEIFYLTTDSETGQETSYDYEGLLREAEEQKKGHICEICGACDYEEVGIATGENGVEMRVCENCDLDGSDYNGWGDKEESEEEQEEEEENDDWKYLCPKLHWGGNYGCDLCNCEGKVIADKDNCNMEKVWLNKKGIYDYRLHKKWFEEREEKEESESEEEEEEEVRVRLFECEGKTYYKSVEGNFIYDRETKESIGIWSEELQKIILDGEVEVELFEFQGKSYFKSEKNNFMYDREKKEVIGVWSEELQKIILNGEETDDQKVIAVVEKHNKELDKTRFSYILSLMINYPCSMEEQDKRRQLLSDKDFAELYAEMISDFMNKK